MKKIAMMLSFGLIAITPLGTFPENQSAAEDFDFDFSALPAGGLPKLTDEDLAEMWKMIEEMNPEELETLAKIGEDVIKKAEKAGIEDPYGFFGLPSKDELEDIAAAPEVPVAGKPEMPQPAEIKVPEAGTKVDQKEIGELREILIGIAEKLSDIEQKAEGDRRAQEMLGSLRYMINDLRYFMLTLKEEKLLKYLVEPEFSELRSTLMDLYNALDHLEPYFNLEDFEVEGISPYTVLRIAKGTSWQEVANAYQERILALDPDVIKEEMLAEGKSEEEIEQKLASLQEEIESINEAYNTILKREQAYQVLDKILDAIVHAGYTKKIPELAKKILEKYEPEALKKKEAQEALEQEARRQQEEMARRRPPYSPRAIEPPPAGPRVDFGDDRGRAADEYRPSFQPPAAGDKKDIIKPTEPAKPGKAPGRPDKAGAPKEKEKGEKGTEAKRAAAKPGETAKVNPKVGKKLENIEKELKGLKIYVTSSADAGGMAKDTFKDFKQYLADPSVDTTRAKAVNKALEEINKYMVNILKELDTSDLEQKADVESFKKQAHNLIKKYLDAIYETTGYKHLKEQLFGLKVKDKKINETLNPKKRYLHTGEVSKGQDTKSKEFEALKKVNPLSDEGLGKDYLDIFVNNFHRITQKITK